MLRSSVDCSVPDRDRKASGELNPLNDFAVSVSTLTLQWFFGSRLSIPERNLIHVLEYDVAKY